MTNFEKDIREQIDALSDPNSRREDTEPEHDPTNGRWFEKYVADKLEGWGYRTSRNEQLFGLETDVVAQRDEHRNEPTDYLVVECKDWQTTRVPHEAVEDIALRALLARAMPVLAVSWSVTDKAWTLAQVLDVRILTGEDLHKDSLPPLTERRPPRGTFRTRREASIAAFRDHMPLLLQRWSGVDVEAPVFHPSSDSPCYVPDRTGNDEYVDASDSDYNFD